MLASSTARRTVPAMRPASRYLACTPARRRRVARSGKAPAFTLLELIVVIVVLAILALLAIPTFTGVIRKSKDATAEATLSALGRDVAALAALNGGTITAGEIQTAVSELPSSAAAPGRFAAGTTYTLTSGTSSAPGQIAYAISSGGSKAGLAEVAPSGDVVYALASSSGVQTWVGCSAATGAEALGGPSGTSACSSGSSSSAQGSGGATVIGSTTTTTTAGPTPSGYETGVLADNPIGYWLLNETSGPTAADASGNGNAGTYDGAVSFNATTTPFGASAVFFNGGYVTLPSFPAGTFANGFSVEAWVKVPSFTPEHILTLGSGASTNNFDFGLETNGRAYFNACSGGTCGANQYTPPLSTGTWYDLVATETPAGSVAIYVNGKKVMTGSDVYPQTSVAIGGTSYIANNPWGNPTLSGDVSNVAVFPAALSSAQVAAQYANG